MSAGAPSAEQRLEQIADAARRAERALRLWSHALIMTPPEDRPRPNGEGRVSVTVEAWNAWASNRDAVGELIRLAKSGCQAPD